MRPISSISPAQWLSNHSLDEVKHSPKCSQSYVIFIPYDIQEFLGRLLNMNDGSNFTGACAVGPTNPGFNQQFPGSDDGKHRTVLQLKTMVSAVPSSHHPFLHLHRLSWLDHFNLYPPVTHLPLNFVYCAFAICEWVKMGYPKVTRKNTLDDLLGAFRLIISYT